MRKTLFTIQRRKKQIFYFYNAPNFFHSNRNDLFWRQFIQMHSIVTQRVVDGDFACIYGNSFRFRKADFVQTKIGKQTVAFFVRRSVFKKTSEGIDFLRYLMYNLYVNLAGIV